MFNCRINNLGGWAPNVTDVFVNKTGGTLTRGKIAAVDAGGAGDAPMGNLVAVNSSRDKGWLYVVCLNQSVANDEIGHFGIIGIFEVELASGVSIGDRISGYGRKEADGAAIVGAAAAAGPGNKPVFFNGFCISAAIAQHRVVAKTADYSPLPSESGTTFTTDGATATVRFTLPTAVVGLRYRFRVGAAQALEVDPNGTETIAVATTGVQSAAGVHRTNSTNGCTLDVECTKAGQWSVFGKTGSWGGESVAPATVTRIQWLVSGGAPNEILFLKITTSAASTFDGFPGGPINATLKLENGNGDPPNSFTGTPDNNFDGANLYFTFAVPTTADQDSLGEFTVNSWGTVTFAGGAAAPATGHKFTPGDGVMDLNADPDIEF
jgi:hypothetical protein